MLNIMQKLKKTNKNRKRKIRNKKLKRHPKKKKRKNHLRIVKVIKSDCIMGSSSSKVAVSSVKLVTKKQPNKNTRNLVLNPRLCQSIFDNNNEFCHQKDVQHLRKFMFSDSNLKPTSMSKKKVLENELIKYINLPQSETKVLTPKTSKHLEAILVHLKGQTILQKPYLVSDIIETKLENIYERNNALQQQHQSLQWTSWLQSLCSLYVFYVQIQANS